MNKSGKELIFFSLTLMVFYIALIVNRKTNKKNSTLMDLLITTLATLLVVGVFYALGLEKSDNIDNFSFQVDGPRRCDGGPYMWDKKLAKYCSQFTPEQIEKANCLGGLYNGKPIGFSYSSLSNENWKNTSTEGCVKNNKWVCPESDKSIDGTVVYDELDFNQL